MFIWLLRRHDLFPLAKLADYCARVPGSVARDEKLRTQALDDLEDAVLNGALGRVLWLPESLPLDQQVLVLTPGQIMAMREWGRPVIGDLYAPRAQCALWLKTRGIPAPEGLTAPAIITIEGQLAAAEITSDSPTDPTAGQPTVALPASPPRPATNADLDDCIKASAAKKKDGKTSRNQLRHDAPLWFAERHIRPVTQADMERRLIENNGPLRRTTGKRSH